MNTRASSSFVSRQGAPDTSQRFFSALSQQDEAALIRLIDAGEVTMSWLFQECTHSQNQPFWQVAMSSDFSDRVATIWNERFIQPFFRPDGENLRITKLDKYGLSVLDYVVVLGLEALVEECISLDFNGETLGARKLERKTSRDQGSDPMATLIAGQERLIQEMFGTKGKAADKATETVVTNSAFVLAAAAGNVAILRLFIASGVDVNTPNDDGRTALAEAILAGQGETALFLLDQGASVEGIGGVVKVAFLEWDNAELFQRLQGLGVSFGEPKKLLLPLAKQGCRSNFRSQLNFVDQSWFRTEAASEALVAVAAQGWINEFKQFCEKGSNFMWHISKLEMDADQLSASLEEKKLHFMQTLFTDLFGQYDALQSEDEDGSIKERWVAALRFAARLDLTRRVILDLSFGIFDSLEKTSEARRALERLASEMEQDVALREGYVVRYRGHVLSIGEVQIDEELDQEGVNGCAFPLCR